MIPRVAKSGRSFKGAALYYLHDKNALSSDRVAFTETLNLPTDNADIAVAHMVDTATHASQLKQAAGIKGGRPLQTPVYCYSLAWHPSETPTKADQLQAVQDTLKRLGVSDRQAVVIGHNDTDHTHVHVMVNRVCPATGKAANMGNDQIKLSEWALQYRKERGEEHFCPQREENQTRRKGEFVKDGSMSRKEWVAWKKSQSKDIWDNFRADRAMASASRKPQYDALWRQKEERFALRRDEIKALYKPIWRDVFKRQSQELKDFDAGLTRRITFALAQPKGKVLGVVQAVIAKGDLRVDFVRKQEAERAEISGGQKARIVDASREINKAWKYDRDQLKTLHKAQDQQVYDNTQVKSNEVWQDRSLDKSGQDFEQSADRRRPANEQNRKTFESEFGSDKEAMAEARKVQDEIKKRNRQRKRSRGRNRDDGGRDMEP